MRAKSPLVASANSRFCSVICALLFLAAVIASTASAAAAFTGTRNGEITGFNRDNYDGSEIKMEKSVWRSHIEEPKRPKTKGQFR
jgi:hypothetical protein